MIPDYRRDALNMLRLRKQIKSSNRRNSIILFVPKQSLDISRLGMHIARHINNNPRTKPPQLSKKRVVASLHVNTEHTKGFGHTFRGGSIMTAVRSGGVLICLKISSADPVINVAFGRL